MQQNESLADGYHHRGSSSGGAAASLFSGSGAAAGAAGAAESFPPTTSHLSDVSGSKICETSCSSRSTRYLRDQRDEIVAA